MNTTSHASLPAVAPFTAVASAERTLTDRLLAGGLALLAGSFVVVVALEVWGLAL